MLGKEQGWVKNFSAEHWGEMFGSHCEQNEEISGQSNGIALKLAEDSATSLYQASLIQEMY